jgi:hypothetical protein
MLIKLTHIVCFACFRWKSGVASSLNYFVMSDEKSPVLHPYPSWEANTLPEENHNKEDESYGGGRADAKAAEKGDNLLEKNNGTIISTFRIRADECDRLWVMDSGLADILGSPKQWAPNSIAVYDLNTDKLIKRFVIPDDQVKEDSFFANIVSKIVFNLASLSTLSFSRSSTHKYQIAATPSHTCQTWAATPLSSMILRTTSPTESSTTSSTLTRCKEI